MCRSLLLASISAARGGGRHPAHSTRSKGRKGRRRRAEREVEVEGLGAAVADRGSNLNSGNGSGSSGAAAAVCGPLSRPRSMAEVEDVEDSVESTDPVDDEAGRLAKHDIP